MNGAFRYGKSVAAGLLMAVIGFAGRQGSDWLFPHVDPLDGENSVMLNVQRVSAPVRIDDADSVRWRVPVVTNRPSESTSEPPAADTSLETRSLSQQVADAIYHTAENRFQLCEVAVPRNRQRGACPVVEAGEDHQSAVQITAREQLNDQQFVDITQQLLNRSEANDIMVMVHGFNVTFDNAITRAAQVAEDMPFNGVVVVYSWSSQGQTLAYRQDEAIAERHFWGLADLLHTLRGQLPSECRLHLLAHSMGNRVTLRALNALAGTIDPVGRPTDMFVAARIQNGAKPSDAFPDAKSLQPGIFRPHHQLPERFPNWAAWTKSTTPSPPLTNLILAAPDVGAAEFQRFVTDTRYLAENVTLYTSSSDLALEASARVHGDGYRAGDSRAGLSLPDVKVIRVSAPGANDWLGHSYYGSQPTVLNQLHRLTMRATLPTLRTALADPESTN